MSHITDTLTNNWAANMADGGSRHLSKRQSSNVTVAGDAIQSYGWWEMARLLRNPKTRQAERFLVNGDIYSVTTSRQQSTVRHAISRTDLPSVIIPFSVLDEAGIDKASITILEATADWTETTEHRHIDMPNSAVWEYEYETIPGTGVYVHNATGESLPSQHAYSHETYCYVNEYDDRKAAAVGPIDWQDRTGPNGYDAVKAREDAFDAEWTKYPAISKSTGRKTLRTAKGSWHQWEVVADDSETNPSGIAYRRETLRHWLGESLITGSVRYQTTIKCDRCTGSGTYDGDTRNVLTPVIGPQTRELGGNLPRYWLDRPTCNLCFGEGRRTITKTRTSRYLSGFDSNETRVSYFFCELPKHSKATTVQEAYADLKPATVKTAEALGRTVHRQGDIYAVPITTMTTADLTRLNAVRSKKTHILGTNHRATEVAMVRNGKATLTYARGTLTHAPLNRDPDHKRVTIGKSWHLLLKNTVPVSA
ncbi:hypothetical protein [Frigoribacterium sp. CG_9.8]|uniref:hypothetical protein n=1 Tax=Frigoribacterium sp. CG_9.8 TaxID=2787733 RepID=UPI0018CA1D78|nr:hypothetical protein [Frigoribacterium sp. CG_9.8]MBG6106583.1 hypothetical protein [Frigoribacterium sp. CG_9.8]